MKRISIYPEILDQPQAGVSITHRIFSSYNHPRLPSTLSSAKDTSNVSRYLGKTKTKDNRLIDRYCDCRMGDSLLETSEPPRHRATLELAGKGRWATSGSDHQAKRRIRTSRLEKWVILHMYHQVLTWTVYCKHTAHRHPTATHETLLVAGRKLNLK